MRSGKRGRGRQGGRWTEGHTLICKEATQVIVPLGALYLLGYRIRWEEGICCIKHASRGPLPVRMRQFCPEVPTEVALRLVEELEEFNKGLLRRAATAATKSMRKPDVKKGLCSRVAEAWKKGEMEKVKGEFEKLFPEVPVALMERALATKKRKGNRLEPGGNSLFSSANRSSGDMKALATASPSKGVLTGSSSSPDSGTGGSPSGLASRSLTSSCTLLDQKGFTSSPAFGPSPALSIELAFVDAEGLGTPWLRRCHRALR